MIKDLVYKNNRDFELIIPYLEFLPGINAIIGPNAVGKSTLLKCLAGVYRITGTIDYGSGINKDNLYDYMAYLPQEANNDPHLTVLEMVLLGRWRTLGWRVNDSDLKQVADILEMMNCADLADRYYSELSAGQKQAVNIAQALVKDPQFILMDEPTSNLDLKNKFEIMEIIQSITREKQVCSIIVMHDLDLAFQYADQAVILDKGRLFGAGHPREVLKKEMLSQVYGVEADVISGQHIVVTGLAINGII